jgi:hypothetical protein
MTFTLKQSQFLDQHPHLKPWAYKIFLPWCVEHPEDNRAMEDFNAVIERNLQSVVS